MSNALTAEAVQAALKEVKLPGANVDVVTIRLIGEIRIEDGKVNVPVIKTTEKKETIEGVVTAVRERLEKLEGAAAVNVFVEDRSAPKKKAPTGPHGQSADPFADRQRIPGVDKVIAVASAKGGVGKSSVAVNLALALREKGLKVGILDADVYGPSVPTMLDIRRGPEVTEEKKIIPVEAQGLKTISMGMMMAPDQPVIWRGPLVFSAIKQFIQDVLWDGLDYLVVDLPPGTGDAQLTLVQQVPLSGVVMVTTPQEVALADVRRGIRMFQQVDVPVLGIVENMSYFACPGCGQEHDLFGRGGGAQVAQAYRLPLLAEIPIDPSIRQGGDEGRPAVLNTEGAVREAFLSLAGKVTELSVEIA